MAAPTDPAWLAHRYDPTHDAVHYVHADRPLRASVPFLTDDHLKPTESTIVDRRDALAMHGESAEVRMIFHSAFCCSTLLAAALDVQGVASAFKEPVILNDLTGWMHRGADRRELAGRLDNALTLLRPFEPREAAVIKPSNVFNGLSEAVLGLRPHAKAILMYAPLRTFVTSVARKGMWGRLWVRDLLGKQLLENYIHLGFETRDYLLLTDLQAAAVVWLAQQKAFAALATRWPERVRSLNSEALVAEPARALVAAAALYQLKLSEPQIDTILRDVFGRDAKNGAAFVPGQRELAAKTGATLHGEEIDKVLIWAEAVAKNAGVPLDLPLALI